MIPRCIAADVHGSFPEENAITYDTELDIPHSYIIGDVN
jgi:hypothetical protein